MEKITKYLLLGIKDKIAMKQGELEIARNNLLVKCDNVYEKMNKAASTEGENRAVEILQSVITVIETELCSLKNEYTEKIQSYRLENGSASEF